MRDQGPPRGPRQCKMFFGNPSDSLKARRRCIVSWQVNQGIVKNCNFGHNVIWLFKRYIHVLNVYDDQSSNKTVIAIVLAVRSRSSRAEHLMLCETTLNARTKDRRS